MAIDINAILQSLFGTGGQEVGGGGAAQVGSANLVSPEQQELLSKLVGMISGTPMGVDVAGASPLQNLAFGGAEKFINDPAMADSYAQSGGAISDLLGEFDPQSTTDYFNQAIKAPALQTFEQDIIPMIQESFAGIGAGSSSGLNLTLGKEGSNLASDLSSQLATLLFNTENQTNMNRLNALGQASQFRQQPFDIMNTLAGLGDAQRGIETEQILGGYTHPYERFLNPALQTQGTAPIVQQNPFTVTNTGLLPF